MQRITAFTEDDLTELLVRAARLGASQALAEVRPKDVMTKKELADYLRVSVATIDRKMKHGLPHFFIGDASPRFYKARVDEWMETNGDIKLHNAS